MKIRRRTTPNSIGGTSDPTFELAERLVAETEHGEAGREERLRPNARAHRGAAMETHFGDTVDDPDSRGGSAVDAAMDRYEIFHDKAPIRVAELDHDLPDKWVKTGECLAVMYRTDKWRPDGDDEDYKHLHDTGDDKPYPLGKGVKFFEPASEVSKSRVPGKRRRTSRNKSQRLPVAAPKAVTLLGYCLGFFVRRDDDETIYELNPRGAWLFSSPSGNMLCVYSPKEGFLGAMAGGKLRVLKDGIDG